MNRKTTKIKESVFENIDYHFSHVGKMVFLGSGVKREIQSAGLLNLHV
jgi:hypothetical protein